MPKLHKPGVTVNAGTDAPSPLRPYEFHGVVLGGRPNDRGDVQGDCPLCGKAGKFSVNSRSGQWKCWACNAGSDRGGGNALTFIRLLWERSVETTTDYADLAAERKLLDPTTLSHWGVCRSALDAAWLVPGWGADGKLIQLYKRGQDRAGGGAMLWPTPGMPEGSGLFRPLAWDPARPLVEVLEGPWSAMAFWETLRAARPDAGGLKPTGNDALSLLSGRNVCGVPGCGSVGAPFEKWLPLFAGKGVTLWFDSDHPKRVCAGCKETWSAAERTGKCPSCGGVKGSDVPPAGLAATKRAVRIFDKAKAGPASVSWLPWGEAGFDGLRKSGWDVRDELAQAETTGGRVKILGGLLARTEPTPPAWLAVAAGAAGPQANIAPASCNRWAEVTAAWQDALFWRQDLEDALAVMLAVCASTLQQGSQLFLQLIGPPSSAKTRLCDAILVSRHCHALEHLTGFISGSKGAEEADDEGRYSLISRVNGKTLVTPEMDVLVSSPNFPEIMAQMRRIFDGTSGATYKNRADDLRWTGLRTPWIGAGTLALLSINQASLGDRFLRIFLEPPTEDDKRKILRKVIMSASKAAATRVNGEPDGHVEESLLRAYKLTGGYVDWLRGEGAGLIRDAGSLPDGEKIIDEVGDMAEFCADFRARPNLDFKKLDAEDVKEEPNRLAEQLMRLACCLAVVLNRPGDAPDAEVLRIVRKAALGTARGKTLEVGRALAMAGDTGLDAGGVGRKAGMGPERSAQVLNFLAKMKVANWRADKGNPGAPPRWRLTPRAAALWKKVVGAGGEG